MKRRSYRTFRRLHPFTYLFGIIFLLTSNVICDTELVTLGRFAITVKPISKNLDINDQVKILWTLENLIRGFLHDAYDRSSETNFISAGITGLTVSRSSSDATMQTIRVMGGALTFDDSSSIIPSENQAVQFVRMALEESALKAALSELFPGLEDVELEFDNLAVNEGTRSKPKVDYAPVIEYVEESNANVDSESSQSQDDNNIENNLPQNVNNGDDVTLRLSNSSDESVAEGKNTLNGPEAVVTETNNGDNNDTNKEVSQSNSRGEDIDNETDKEREQDKEEESSSANIDSQPKDLVRVPSLAPSINDSYISSTVNDGRNSNIATGLAGEGNSNQTRKSLSSKQVAVPASLAAGGFLCMVVFLLFLRKHRKRISEAPQTDNVADEIPVRAWDDCHSDDSGGITEDTSKPNMVQVWGALPGTAEQFIDSPLRIRQILPASSDESEAHELSYDVEVGEYGELKFEVAEI